jgi:hypothetical protein
MAVLPDTRSQFYLSLVTVVVILAAYEARARRRRATNPDEQPAGRWRSS